MAQAQALVKAARDAARAASDEADAIEIAAQKATTYSEALKRGVSSDAIVEGMAQSVGVISSAFAKAQGAANQGAEKYVADLLLGSKTLQGAFLEAGKLSAEGFEELAKLVEGGSGDFAKALRERGASARKVGSPSPPTINMTGGQTFKIQQDFRDQDPDRVAIALEEGIGRLVTRRVAAGTSSPFGT
jgi:hypothetical protein